MRQLVHKSGAYLISNILSRGVIFLLLPVLSRYLSPADYGVIAMYEMTLFILLPIIGLNTHGFISVKYYAEREKISGYIGNAVLLTISSFWIILLALHFSRFSLSRILSIPPNWLYWIPIVALGQCLCDIFLTILQVKGLAIYYGCFRIFQIITDVSLSLYFIIVMKLDWTGRIMGSGIAVCILGTVAYLILSRKKLVMFKFNDKYIKNALLFGLPLIPHAIGGWVISMSNRLFINKLQGIEATGIYTAGSQVAMVILVIATSFNLAWTPFLYERLKKSESEPAEKLRLVKLTYMYDLFLLVLAIILGLSAHVIIGSFLDKRYIMASDFVVWIALGYAFNGMYFMVSNYLFYAEKTYILTMVTVTAAIFNIGATYILIKLNGTIGAAQASCLTFFVFFILTWLASNKVYRMPWRLSLS